jgi:hypothetical protein
MPPGEAQGVTGVAVDAAPGLVADGSAQAESSGAPADEGGGAEGVQAETAMAANARAIDATRLGGRMITYHTPRRPGRGLARGVGMQRLGDWSREVIGYAVVGYSVIRHSGIRAPGDW